MKVQILLLVLCAIETLLFCLAGVLGDNGYKKTMWVLLAVCFTLMFVMWVLGVLFRSDIRRERGDFIGRTDDNKCRDCGYDLRGNQTGVCPECGNAVAPTEAEPDVGRRTTIEPAYPVAVLICLPLFCLGLKLAFNPNDRISSIGIVIAMGFGAGTLAFGGVVFAKLLARFDEM
jgi:hypothetical protein